MYESPNEWGRSSQGTKNQNFRRGVKFRDFYQRTMLRVTKVQLVSTTTCTTSTALYYLESVLKSISAAIMPPPPAPIDTPIELVNTFMSEFVLCNVWKSPTVLSCVLFDGGGIAKLFDRWGGCGRINIAGPPGMIE